jgi:hypothetical protein
LNYLTIKRKFLLYTFKKIISCHRVGSPNAYDVVSESSKTFVYCRYAAFSAAGVLGTDLERWYDA